MHDKLRIPRDGDRTSTGPRKSETPGTDNGKRLVAMREYHREMCEYHRQQQLQEIWNYAEPKLRESIQRQRMDPNRQGEPLNMAIKLPPNLQDILDKDPKIKEKYDDLIMNLAIEEITKSIQEKNPLITSTELSRLCDDTQEKMVTELAERKKNNPTKTDEEQKMGVYIEEIEPQVRDAVLGFNRRGYSTSSSGFEGKKKEYQSIAGRFTLNEDTKAKLKNINVEIIENKGWQGNIDEIIAENREEREEWKGSTLIRFKPEEPNLEAMKEEWAKITELIPDKDESALPSQTDRTPTRSRDQTPTGNEEDEGRIPTEAERLAIQQRLREALEAQQQHQAQETDADRSERERSYNRFWELVEPQISSSLEEAMMHPQTFRDWIGNHRRETPDYNWNPEMNEIFHRYPDVPNEMNIRIAERVMEISRKRSVGVWVEHMLSNLFEKNDSGYAESS